MGRLTDRPRQVWPLVRQIILKILRHLIIKMTNKNKRGDLLCGSQRGAGFLYPTRGVHFLEQAAGARTINARSSCELSPRLKIPIGK